MDYQDKELNNFCEKYYGCYIYTKNYLDRYCTFYFDYEEMLLWEYYLICKRLYTRNQKYNYKNVIISNLIQRMFQYYKRNKDNVASELIENTPNTHYNIDDFELICKTNNIVYDYLYNNMTIRDLKNKYNISQNRIYKELREFYDKEIK